MNEYIIPVKFWFEWNWELNFGVAFIAVGYRSRTVRKDQHLMSNTGLSLLPGSIQAEIIVRGISRNEQQQLYITRKPKRHTVEPRLTTTPFIRSLLRPYSFKPNIKNIHSFYYFEDPVNATTSLLRPGFYGPTVVALTGFHCRSCNDML